MAISFTVTVVFKAASSDIRNDYLISQATLANLTPLYPTLNLTEADMNTIIQELTDDVSIEFQQLSNPGLLSGTVEPYDGPLGVGDTVTRIYSDITSYELTRSQNPILFDHRLYTLDGTNLIKVSDGTVESELTPKEYVRWQWIFYAQVETTRGDPIEV